MINPFRLSPFSLGNLANKMSKLLSFMLLNGDMSTSNDNTRYLVNSGYGDDVLSTTGNLLNFKDSFSNIEVHFTDASYFSYFDNTKNTFVQKKIDEWSGNIVVNGEFDYGLNDWTVNSLAIASVVDNVLFLERGTSPYSDNFYQPEIIYKAGISYEYEFKVESIGIEDTAIRFRVSDDEVENTIIKSKHTYTGTATPTVDGYFQISLGGADSTALVKIKSIKIKEVV